MLNVCCQFWQSQYKSVFMLVEICEAARTLHIQNTMFKKKNEKKKCKVMKFVYNMQIYSYSG